MTASTHTVTLSDGRVVTTDVTGPNDGPTVVLFQAAPGSRRFDPDPAVTTGAGLRLVSFDRPGYGGSTPLADGVVASIPQYADDAAAVLDDLGIDDATLVGWSAGGRVAAAVAARRPDVAREVLIVATPAPDDEVPWIPEEQRSAIELMKADPVAAVGQLVAMLGEMTSEPAGASALVTAGAADEATLAADPALRRRLEAMLDEAFAQGPIGLALDLVSYTVAPWGFDPASIGAQTTCIYGAADGIVTPTHGEWWASRIPSAELRVVPAAGHLVITTAWERFRR